MPGVAKILFAALLSGVEVGDISYSATLAGSVWTFTEHLRACLPAARPTELVDDRGLDRDPN